MKDAERWDQIRGEIAAYAQAHPELIPRFITYDHGPVAGQTWAGRADMARARQAVGHDLNALDCEALAKVKT